MEEKSVYDVGQGSGDNVGGDIESQKRILSCYCNKPVVILNSWKNNNPGRRFYRCPKYKAKDCCEFFAWYDEGKVNGWPKFALIEVHDELRESRFEIRRLSDMVKKLEEENRRLARMGDATNSESNGIRQEINSIERGFERIIHENSSLKSENMDFWKQIKQLKKENHGFRLTIIFSWTFFMWFTVMCAYMVVKNV